MNKKKKSRIEEINEKVEKLRYKVDNLTDCLEEIINRFGFFGDYTISSTSSTSSSTKMSSLSSSSSSAKPCLRYKKTHEDAMEPTKSHESDSGFDLNLVKLIKTKGNVEYYSTGIQLMPPPHNDQNKKWYFELHARSSLVKTGYQLANCVGIIDNPYRGDIIAALIKFDDNKPPLELPSRLVQIIPREMHDFSVKQVKQLPRSDRGSGGFGSTNKKQKQKHIK